MPQSGEETPHRSFTYSFGPFAFHSQIELPELPELPVAGSANSLKIPIEVALGAVPGSILEPTFHGQYCSASPYEVLVHIPHIASYHVRAGSVITIQPDPQAQALDVRGFLLGNVFAILCHQRRFLPLHASAVRMGGGVVAFLGNSGAGKSTLAAYLSSAGYPLVADDICLLDPAAPAEIRVLPVAPWLKLWRTSLDALGQPSDGLAQTFSDEDKFRIPLVSVGSGRHGQPTVETERLPLRAVIVLETTPAEAGGDDAQAALTPLKPVQAIAQMMNFTYQAYLLQWLGLQTDHFASCGKGLEGAEAYSCMRAWTFGSLPSVLNCLKAEFGQD